MTGLCAANNRFLNRLFGNSRVTLAGLVIAFVGVAFMFGGHPVISAMLLLLAWMLVVLDEDMKSG